MTSPTPPRPLLSQPELEHLVSRIAPYPDPLLAQVLAASTYRDEIPEAARRANEHSYLQGSALADAISAAIRFGPAVIVGTAFAPWGSVSPGFVWGTHAILIGRSPWDLVWFNRGFYVHPYIHPWIRPPDHASKFTPSIADRIAGRSAQPTTNEFGRCHCHESHSCNTTYPAPDFPRDFYGYHRRV